MAPTFSDVAWLVSNNLPSGSEKWEVVAKIAISGALGKPSEHSEKLTSLWQEEAKTLLGPEMCEKNPHLLMPRPLIEHRFWPTTVPQALLRSLLNISPEELESSFERVAVAKVTKTLSDGLPSNAHIIRLLGLGVKPIGSYNPVQINSFWWDVVTFASHEKWSWGKILPKAKFHCSEEVAIMLLEVIEIPHDYFYCEDIEFESDSEDSAEYEDGDKLRVPLSWCLINAGYVNALSKLLEKLPETQKPLKEFVAWHKEGGKRTRHGNARKSGHHDEDLLTAALISKKPLEVRLKICKMLLECGADPNNMTAPYNGLPRSPLMVAAQQGCFEVCEMMLEYGGDPLRLTFSLSKTSAYTEAVENKQERMLELFDAWKLSLCSTEEELAKWKDERAALQAPPKPNTVPTGVPTKKKGKKKKKSKGGNTGLSNQKALLKEKAIADLVENAEKSTVTFTSNNGKTEFMVHCPLCILTKSAAAAAGVTARTFRPASLRDHVMMSNVHKPFRDAL